MNQPTIDLGKYLARIPTHVTSLPGESQFPYEHYGRSSNDAWNLLKYVERNLAKANVYPAPFERHMRRLSTMVLLGIVEAFERFLKEIAAECINQIAYSVIDDRFDVFSVKGHSIASHFSGGNVGRALCESLTWCDCDETNRRFRRILADPFDGGTFYLFPLLHQGPSVLRGRYELMSIIWQLRHTIAHNCGMMTSSDALKFRLLTKSNVESPRLLWPSRADVGYVKLFLDETAELINREIGRRLAELLTTLYSSDTSLFVPGAKANELAKLFGTTTIVAGEAADPS